MKIIISPAKKMRDTEECIAAASMPVFLEKTMQLQNHLKSMDREGLKQLLSCNEKIAELNYNRYKNMDLGKTTNPSGFVPALTAYEGLQFQYMGPQVFTEEQWKYASRHLYILSGFYGILRPLDAIVPYRLEMQASLGLGDAKNLYEYWGNSIYSELTCKDSVILNLASKEYSKVIEPYVSGNVQMITCKFGELRQGKIKPEVKVKGTLAKMARGEMVRWICRNQIDEAERVKEFSGLGYLYSEQYSTPTEFVFLPKSAIFEN